MAEERHDSARPAAKADIPLRWAAARGNAGIRWSNADRTLKVDEGARRIVAPFLQLLGSFEGILGAAFNQVACAQTTDFSLQGKASRHISPNPIKQ